jgi:hypothetical protein
VTLFGLYHLWTPWLAIGRIAAFFPVSFARMRTRNV